VVTYAGWTDFTGCPGILRDCQKKKKMGKTLPGIQRKGFYSPLEGFRCEDKHVSIGAGAAFKQVEGGKWRSIEVRKRRGKRTGLAYKTERNGLRNRGCRGLNKR